MRPNDCGINDGTRLIDFELERLEHEGPGSALRPVVEPVEDRFPRAEALRKVAPRDARPCPVQHGIDEQAIVRLRSPELLWKHVTKPLPLFVGQSMAMHYNL